MCDSCKNTPNDGYDKALQLMFYEGQISWQMNVLFVGLNIGIGTLIQEKLTHFSAGDPLLIIMSILGIVINFLWWGTFQRNNSYYHFRMAQAREMEPENWKLLKDRGYRFSKGEEIIIENGAECHKDKKHLLGCFELFASNKRAIAVAIWAFILCFFLLLLCSVLPLLCNICHQ